MSKDFSDDDDNFSHFNVSMESFLCFFFVIDTGVIKLVNMIFRHLREARLFYHPEDIENAFQFKRMF